MLVPCVSAPATMVAAQAKELIFDLKLAHGAVPPAMRLIRVKQGDVVRLRWTSDRPIVLHLHGYDIERTVAPGEVAEMAFTANATGRFPVEEHKPANHAGRAHEDQPLLRIEVYPR
jgi:hypothetical protein